MADWTASVWPIVSVLLVILWLVTLLWRRRGRRSAEGAPAHPRQGEAEDMLKAAYTLQKREGFLEPEHLARKTGLSETMARQGVDVLVAFGWMDEDDGGNLRLTESGEARAKDLVRAHRLWERYLVDREGMPMEAVHAEAHKREHGTTREELERLDAELGHPAWDPHGHAIPGPDAVAPSSPGSPLSILLIWLLGNLPPGAPFERTPVGVLVRTLTPVGCVFGLTGEMMTALLFTLPAKEIVVPALAMTYGLQSSLAESRGVLNYLPQVWGPLSSYTFMVFFMLYLPCLVTVWATWKETRSLRWTAMGLAVPLTTASLITLVVYQGGRLLGF